MLLFKYARRIILSVFLPVKGYFSSGTGFQFPPLLFPPSQVEERERKKEREEERERSRERERRVRVACREVCVCACVCVCVCVRRPNNQNTYTKYNLSITHIYLLSASPSARIPIIRQTILSMTFMGQGRC